MKNIITIFKRDIRVIFKNPIPLIITLGVAILPSLYAWVNIAASWDPYSNTSTIPIAVVNNDIGTKLNDKYMNIGNEVIENLKKNDAIGWRFTTSKEAELGVIDSTYYASIEIPEDFSEKLTSLISENPEKPTIIYKVDTKENPVANKITTVAQETLIKQIKSNFLITVNETVFSSLKNMADKLDENKDKIISLKNLLIKVDNNMDLILNSLDHTSNNADILNTYLSELNATLPMISDSLNNMQDSNTASTKLAENTKDTIDIALKNLDSNMNILSSNRNSINTLLSNLSIGNKDLYKDLESLQEQIKTDSEICDSLSEFLSSINNNTSIPSAEIANLAAKLESLNTLLNEQSNNIEQLINYYQSSNDINSSTLSKINSINSDINSKIDESLSLYNNSIRTIVANTCNNYIEQINATNKIIDRTKDMTNDISSILKTVSKGTELTETISNDLKEKLVYFRDSIGYLSDNLQKVNDDDLSKIISILQSDSSLMADYISNPFNISNESIYKVDNYGSGMAPIYSVLAMWVGAVILTSIFSTDVKGVEGSENFTSKEKYLGKLLLFAILSVIQGTIIMLGNKLLLGVQVSNLILFILFGAITSLTFSIIIYTNVSLFDNIGKAFNVILLVLQLAGSGGAYPIQVAPLIFKILQPFFPFTYALSGIRESIAGVLVSQTTLDFSILILFGSISLLFGLFFKDKVSKYIYKFHEKFEESELAE